MPSYRTFRKKRKTEDDLLQEAESKFKKFRRKTFKLISHKFFHLTITGFVIVLTGTGLYVYKGIQNDLDTYSQITISTMNNIEDGTVICRTTSVNNELMGYFQADKTYDIRKELRQNISNLVNQRQILGRHISYENYLESAKLVCWASAILSSGMKLCSMTNLMKDPDQMDVWRRKLEAQIEKDKEYHQQISAWMVDYYNYITSLFSQRKAAFEDLYPAPPKCNIEEISKYIDELR